MDAQTVNAILTVLIGAGVVGLFRLSSKVTTLDTAIRGVNGDNGIVGSVKELRSAAADHGDRLTRVEGHVAELREARP